MRLSVKYSDSNFVLLSLSLTENVRSCEPEELHDEERPPTRREKRGPRNADRERNVERTNTASSSKDGPAGSSGEVLDSKPPDLSTNKADRAERKDKDKPPRKDRQAEKKPRAPRKDDRQQTNKKEPPP